MSEATGLSLEVVRRGLREVASSSAPVGRVRRPGGGRKSLVHHDPELLDALQDLVDPATRGDPESPLRWTTKSTRRLSEQLTKAGHRVSATSVRRLLKSLGFSLQRTRKTKEGRDHPARDQQFQYINTQVEAFQSLGQPVISIDTKKKELVREFANGGQEWQPSGSPIEVLAHDFPSDAVGRAIPYGVYDLTRDEGWVSVGLSKDTAEFATNTIQAWWDNMCSNTYPNAKKLMMTADCGGSNGYRLRLWRTELQRLADTTGLEITVCHFPPGASKWNKIEHRMWSQVTKNWRGQPLTSFAVVVSLIGATTTRTGLTINAALDERIYATGIQVSDEDLEAVEIRRHTFHGEWNYTIAPSPPLQKR